MTEERNTTKTTRTRTDIFIVMLEAYDDTLEFLGKMIDSVWLDKGHAEAYIANAEANGRRNLYIETHASQD